MFVDAQLDHEHTTEEKKEVDFFEEHTSSNQQESFLPFETNQSLVKNTNSSSNLAQVSTLCGFCFLFNHFII